MDLQSNFGPAGDLLKNAFKSLTDEMQMCIQDCTVCQQICTQMITHCLELGGLHSSIDHIKALMDCAEICATSAGFMNRNSHLHHVTCKACSVACFSCAESCEQFGSQDQMMKACADICRRCAESCEKMAAKH